MISLYRNVRNLLLSFFTSSMAVFSVSTIAVEISEEPVYAPRFPDPNLMLILDDSGSMHLEMLVDTDGGTVKFIGGNTDRLTEPDSGSLIQRGGNRNQGSAVFGNVYPFGINEGDYDGRRHSFIEGHALPPLNVYGFIRSVAYNKGYFDPEVKYEPWPSFGGYSEDFPQSDPKAARLDPFTDKTVDLTTTWTLDSMRRLARSYGDTNDRNWQFLIVRDMVCDDNGSRNRIRCTRGRNEAFRHFDYRPAFYFRVVLPEEKVSYFLDGETKICGMDIRDGNTYFKYTRSPSSFFPERSKRERYAMAPDGQCLEKVQIADAEQMRNFANWFTYYRRRHHALRAGVALGFEGQQRDLFLRMFTINTLNGNNFLEVGRFSEAKQNFLTNVYERSVANGSTPLRAALQRAGDIFTRNRDNNDKPVITHSCQKNNTLLFTDGFNSNGKVGRNQSADNGAPPPFGGQITGSLADLAYDFYHNLNPAGNFDTGLVRPANADADSCNALGLDHEARDYRNKLDSTVADCNVNLHMTTYTMGLNAKGEIFNNIPNRSTVQEAFDAKIANWPVADRPFTPSQIDDLYHAAVNGRGEIFNARKPSDIKQQIRTLLDSLDNGAVVQAGVTGTDAKDVLIQGEFNASVSAGDIKAYRLQNNGFISTVLDNGTPKADIAWSAAKKLQERLNLASQDAAQVARNNRNVITYNGNQGVTFNFNNLNREQKQDVSSIEMVEYLRGKISSNEQFRKRSQILGEIANSRPQFVGIPKELWPDSAPFGINGDRYSDYKKRIASLNNNTGRLPVVYVGANDGMLHGFDASSLGEAGAVNADYEPGSEVLAFIPSAVYSNSDEEGLSYFSSQMFSRKSYVDLPTAVSDVYISNNGIEGKAWRTVLIGGYRTGGKGLFALDVTNPVSKASYAKMSQAERESWAKKTFLWEFNDSSLDTFIDKPQVAMMNSGEWAAIVSGGYSQSEVETIGKLHIIYMEPDATGKPKKRITITTGESGGLSQPSLIDTDRNGTVDRIYAGDLLGNVWRFDVTSASETNWSSVGKKIFRTASNQAITSPVTARFNPYLSAENNDTSVLLAFGTGQFLSFNDVSNSSQQSLYVIKDSNNAQVISRASLLDISDNSEPRSLDWKQINGLKMDLPVSTEKAFVKPVFLKERVFFASTATAESFCESKNNSFVREINLLSGSINTDTRANRTIVDLTLSLGDDGSVILNEVSSDPVSLVNNNSNGTSPESNLSQIQIGSFTQVQRGRLVPKQGRLGWEELIDE